MPEDKKEKMKIKPYIDKLNNSKEYKEFSKKYNKAFMVAGFFIIDLEEGKNLHQIDYYIPTQHKIAAFTLDKGITLQILDTMNQKVPEKLDLKTNIDLDALAGILEDEMKNRNITEEIKKIIAIVQTVDGKKVWNLNCVLSGMGILKAHVDDNSQTVLKMEKSSILDYIKKMPTQQLMDMSAKGKDAGGKSKKDIQGTIKKLEDLEKAIEKEKESYESKLGNGSKSKKSGKKSDKKEEPESSDEDESEESSVPGEAPEEEEN